MYKLTQGDYKNILVFLNRTTLNGEESMTHAVLVQRVISQLEEEKVEEEAKPSENPVKNKDKKK